MHLYAQIGMAMRQLWFDYEVLNASCGEQSTERITRRHQNPE